VDVDDVKPTVGQPLAQQPWCERVYGQLEGQLEGKSVDRNAVDPFDEPAPFTVAPGGGREDLDLMPTVDQRTARSWTCTSMPPRRGR